MENKFKSSFELAQEEINKTLKSESPFTEDGLKLFNNAVENYILELYKASKISLKPNEKILDYHVKKGIEHLENTRPSSRGNFFTFANGTLGILLGITSTMIYQKADFLSSIIILTIYSIGYFLLLKIKDKSESFKLFSHNKY